MQELDEVVAHSVKQLSESDKAMAGCADASSADGIVSIISHLQPLILKA